MKCACCGAEISYIGIDFFKHDGSGSYTSYLYYKELPDYKCASIIFTDPERWVGYHKDNIEERRKTIRCPLCEQYPFHNKELVVYDAAEIACWGIEEGEE